MTQSTWVNVYIDYCKNGTAEKCPRCGSNNVSVTELDTGRPSKTFKCNDCGSFAHFDEKIKKNK